MHTFQGIRIIVLVTALTGICRDVSGQSAKSLIDTIPFDTVINHQFDTIPPSGGYNVGYSADTAMVRFFQPYFIMPLCRPGDTLHPIYLRYIQHAYDDIANVTAKMENIIKTTGCIFQPFPVYGLSPNVTLYRKGDNLTDFFTLDTTKAIYIITKNGNLLSLVEKHGSGVSLLYIDSASHILPYRYIKDSLGQTPIGIMPHTLLTSYTPGSQMKMGYAHNNQVVIGKYYYAYNNEVVHVGGGQPDRFVKHVHNEASDFRFIDADYNGLKDSSLKKYIYDALIGIVTKQKVKEIQQVAETKDYRFIIRGVEQEKELGGRSLVVYVDFINKNTGKVTFSNGSGLFGFIPALKDLIELYDFNFDGYPDVLYRVAYPNTSSAWDEAIGLYDPAKKSYYSPNDVLFIQASNPGSEGRNREVNGITAKLIADPVTSQTFSKKGLSFCVRVINKGMDTSDLINPLDALTFRLANVDSGYNILLPQSSRLLTKNTAFANPSFVVDSVRLNGTILTKDVWQKEKLSLPPKGVYEAFLRIVKTATIPNPKQELLPPQKIINIPKGRYRLLAVLAVMQGDKETHTMVINPVLVTLQ